MKKNRNLEAIKRIFTFFEKKHKRMFIFLLCLIVINSIVEMLGIGAISPLISLAMTNGDLEALPLFLQKIVGVFGISGVNLIITFSIFFILLTFIKNGISLLTFGKTSQFSSKLYSSLSGKLVSYYLGKEYAWHVKQNSSDFTRVIVNEVNNVVRGIIYNLLLIISNFFVALMVLILITLQDWLIALICVTSLGGIYSALYLFLRRRLVSLGKNRFKNAKERFTLLNNAFSGIKEVKVHGKELFFLRRFQEKADQHAKITIRSDIFSILPRYFVETIVFSFFGLLIVFLAGAGKDLALLVPSLSVFLLAGYRIMPTLQNIMRSYNAVLSNLESFKKLRNDLGKESNFSFKNDISLLRMKSSIRLDHISFSYEESKKPLFCEFNFEIKSNEKIGIVGFSGSGKTTLLNILLGIIKPQQGNIYIDDQLLTYKQMDPWKKNIGLVSQDIFLLDGSIKDNIAYGLDEKFISMEKVINAAKQAEIHNTIMKMENGYNTEVGERGILLSGGQSQRIVIARALYNNPDILIFDEATSAMDNITEKAIMNSIENLTGKKTIIIVAHRLSTVKDCDRLLLLDEGKIIGEGSYEYLLENNKDFRRLSLIEEDHNS